MDLLRGRVETWIRDQREKLLVAWSPLPPPQWRWPPWRGDDRKEQERKVREELERRRKQLHELCLAVKAESVSELQDVLCSMVLSECVYKRPAEDMIRVINKFKSDFGGQVVSLERVQPSLDHVPHRYLLAEAGDTLYASFIGTKQYKDIMVDANILQGAIFHDEAEEIDATVAAADDNADNENMVAESLGKPIQSKINAKKNMPRPAAHRGFLARAKGIPALELYKLAQKKNRKLVLCGHSLGGAVAALATLAILRVVASSPSKEDEKVPVKCITFSQPPVGNAALRDYVHRKGWQDFFKTYCIPEDLIPRLLSPAYFHHYNAAPLQAQDTTKTNNSLSIDSQEKDKHSKSINLKVNGREQLVLGLGPVQTSFWRLSRLVPIDSVRKQLDRLKGRKNDSEEISLISDSGDTSKSDKMESSPQYLEIQENSDGISLAPLPIIDNRPSNGEKESQEKCNSNGDSGKWRGVPYLPSYVPFGQLYLLEDSSVKLLSDAEYSKMTSVKSVISELRERFQSHSMKSYRARFQKIYDMIMCVPTSPFLGVDQSSPFPHLQQWLGFTADGAVELGHIVESPVIQMATSIVPLGWNGLPGDKKAEPFKVDVIGYGLHLCTLIQAQVNGNWCSTSVESLPSIPPYTSKNDVQPGLQKMRILVGAPLKQPPTHAFLADSLTPTFPSVTSTLKYAERHFTEGQSIYNEGLIGFVIYCTSDFTTVSKEVYVRTRRVRLIGLEGAGKTSLFAAILSQGKKTNNANFEIVHPQVDQRVVGGLCYADSDGISLQDLQSEAGQFREELRMGLSDLSRKTDLIVLVHNLSHKIPRYHQANTSQAPTALSLLLNEANALGIPWVLAITNKYSVSAHQQKMLVDSVMDAYQASPSMTEVINSCPYVIPTFESSPQIGSSIDNDVSRRMAAQSLILAPINFIRTPFQKKMAVMPVHGVNSLCKLVHRVLRDNEETSFQELARDRLFQETETRKIAALDMGPKLPEKGGSAAAAAVGASIGAGVGIVLALVMGAASALRKP